MRLRADVRHITGSTTHHVAHDPAATEQLGPPVRVEIVQADSGFLLIRYSLEGFAGDTWHATAEEAKRQAEIEFAISPLDWK